MHAISKGSGKSADADLSEPSLITDVISSEFHALAQMRSWKDETIMRCIKFQKDYWFNMKNSSYGNFFIVKCKFALNWLC